ncbi:MAG: peroxide stress protein YaaA [Flavobacteriales bacterium]|nr:peroxide stress protein YaaA [Flavobacteriales bacterium]
MICLLSPAKTIDFANARDVSPTSQPEFLSDATYLADKLRKHSAKHLATLMALNPDLAAQTKERAEAWDAAAHEDGGKPAAMAFQGAVYRGLDAASLSSDDLTFAQGHVRIISGLYGILRPLDRMQPYRLEMGLKWPITAKKKNLYHYWEDRLADHIVDAANGCLINLASNEYSKAILRKDSPVRVITPQFKDDVNGQFKSLMTYAKEARGLMARYLIQQRIENPIDLKKFTGMGYAFNADLSAENNWVFTRKKTTQSS